MREVTLMDTNATAPPAPELLPLLSSPSPAPSPSNNYYGRGMILFPAIPILDSAFDVATLSLISCLILLSVLSLFFIFYLRLKSRKAHYLQNFNSLWSIRLLLVSFVAVWALNEILRLPFIHRRYLYPFLPSLTLSQQARLCKVHVVLSLGFFEPGFLITLLFLVNTSIKKRNSHDMWAMSLIFLTCLPVFLLQMFFVFFSPLEDELPDVFQASSVLSIDYFENKTLLCTYPLFSTMVFAAFGIAYSLGFLFSYWRVVSLVINKGTRVRIHALALSVLISLPTQVLFLAMSTFWRPENPVYGGVMLGMFISVLFCASVGEGILVIKPIADALAAGGDCCEWNAEGILRLRPVEVETQQEVLVVDGKR